MIYVLDNMMMSEDEKQWETKVEEINKNFEEKYDFESIVMEKTEEGNIRYSFAVKMGEISKLQVKAEVTEKNKCQVTEWRTVSERQEVTYHLEEDVELWDGNVDIEE